MRKRVISLVLVCAVALAVSGCGTEKNDKQVVKDEKQEECIDTLKAALEERWDVVSGKSFDEDKIVYKENPENELEKMQKYEGESFEDKDFEKIIHEYIGALKSQVEGAQYVFQDTAQFEELYNVEGYDVRSKCVKKLVDKYDFSVDEKYQDQLDDMVSGKRVKWLPVGESGEVTVANGKLNIQVDGFKRTGWEQYDDGLEAGNYIGAIECTVQNISYEDEYNPDVIIPENVMVIMDDEYVTKEPISSAWSQIDEYNISAGGLIDNVPNGAKVKAGIPCVFSENQTRALIQFDMLPFR